MKAMRSTIAAPKQFFRPGPPSSRRVSVASKDEEESRTPTKATAKPRGGCPKRAHGTGTSDLRTHLFKHHDNELEVYLFRPNCMSWSRTSSATRSASGRETGLLSLKLVCHNTGPVGTKHGTGIPNRFCGTPTSEVTSNSSTLYLGAGHINTGRNIQTYSKAGHTYHRVSPRDRLLLQHFPSPQEGWGSETCDQPQGPQQLCSHRTFQDWREFIL